jgi:hypothetical protein
VVVRQLSKEALNQVARAFGREAVSAGEFVAGFDQLRAENGLGKIHKRKDGYDGIRLAALP